MPSLVLGSSRVYEAHLWLGLCEDTYEDDFAVRDTKVAGLAEFVREQQALDLPTIRSSCSR
jgi:hypothetical protein